MNKTLTLLTAFLLLLSFLGCAGSPPAAISLDGVWVMDSGDEDYINRAALSIKKESSAYKISFGEIIEGVFENQEGPIAFTEEEKMLTATHEGTIIQLETDETGLVFRSFEEDQNRIFHFVRYNK